MDLALRHLKDLARGLELGASTINPFPGLTHWNLDHPDAQLFQEVQRRSLGRAVEIDVFGDGQALPVATGALDYLLASHVIEHMPDTLRSLREWSRVVRPGGIVFLIVPHRDRTADRARPRTSLEHHLADYALAKTVASSPLVPTSHYQVWVTEDLVAVLRRLIDLGWIDWELVEIEDVDSKAGNGFTIVARVRSHTSAPLAPVDAGPVSFHHWTLLYPFQVPARSVEYVTRTSEPDPGLPRGTYRVVPVHSAFPPRAGAPFQRTVGGPVPAPQLETARVVDGRIAFGGRSLCESGYLVAHLPDGRDEPVLPQAAGGEWSVELEGLVIPTGPFEVTPVNLPPGGGSGPRFRLELSAGQ